MQQERTSTAAVAPREDEETVVIGDNVLTVDGANRVVSRLRNSVFQRCLVDRDVFMAGAFGEPAPAEQSTPADRFAELDPARARSLSLLSIGEALFRSHCVAEALSLFSEVARSATDGMERATALNNTATIAYQLGDAPSAVQLLIDALKLYPGHKEATANIESIAREHAKDPAIASIAVLPAARRLRIGQPRPARGWEMLSVTPGEGVDYVGSAADLSRFDSGTFAEIYAADVLERFDYKELRAILTGFLRILVPNGRLSLSVIDLQSLAALLIAGCGQLTRELYIMRLLYGGQQGTNDYRHAGFTESILRGLLESAGFIAIEREESLDHFPDSGQTMLWGKPLYLFMSARHRP